MPATGQGYAGGTVPAQSELAGFYAKPTKPTTAGDAVQQRANIPTWSTLTFADGGQPFSLSAGTTTGWRQSLDLHTGVITTSATWKAPDGHTTKLSYQVLTDRANAHLGLVQLHADPAVVRDGDGHRRDRRRRRRRSATRPARALTAATRQTFVDVKSQTLGVEAAIASQLAHERQRHRRPHRGRREPAQTIGQQMSFPVTAGQTYTFTKYVGIDDSQDTATPVAAAQAEAAPAAANGYDAALTANQVAWAALWNGRIDVLGNNTVATDVNASEFYLWSNTRDGVDWSISPAGLSSNGYDGHIFWDAETWMYPSLLAQHPDLAAGMNAYRFDRLTEAQQHAAATGWPGARFPWESALDGTEQIPPPVSVNSEGLFEQHITADIALAQWQYYLVTGDKAWLANQGWPVISGAAAFWASRAKRGRRRQLPHRQRHRSRRGEPRRQRRGVHQRRRQDDAPGRHRRGRRAGPDPAGVVGADRRRADGADRGHGRHADPPRVRRLRRATGQAGRRDAAAVPVAAPDVALGGPERHQLLRAAHRPGRPVDE